MLFRSIRSRVLPMAVSLRSRSTLEIIRFAAANHLCVALTYGGEVRRIEPYSLRQTIEGNFVLHTVRCDSGEHRSYCVDRMEGASVTSQSFAPRYLIEPTSKGPLPVTATVTGPQLQPVSWGHRQRIRAARRQATINRGPVHVFRCAVCSKAFERRSFDSSVNPHKHPAGYECPGRTGIFIRTKYQWSRNGG